MATITAADVNKLRQSTGAGMMDCKKALVEADGDFDKAIQILREKGQKVAANRSDRESSEGAAVSFINADNTKGAILTLNCETDFVAKNETFVSYVAEVAAQAANTTATDIDAFLAEPWAADTTKTVKEALSAQIAVIGENMNIRRFEKIDAGDGYVVSYIHGGGRIGVLVQVETGNFNEAAKEAAKNIAMQIAAINPQYVTRDEISEEFIAHETEILKAQAKNENPDKPDNIIDKMIVGRLNKELKEFCLVDQIYVKDGDLTVAKYLESAAKEIGSPITVKRFVRYETGEGIEKKSEDFAEEVARQMGK